MGFGGGGGRRGFLASGTDNWAHGAAIHRDGFVGRNQAGVQEEGGQNGFSLKDTSSLFLSVSCISPNPLHEDARRKHSIEGAGRDAHFMGLPLGCHLEDHLPMRCEWVLIQTSVESLVPTVNKNKTVNLRAVPSLCLCVPF